ncbi:cytidine and deoxycytidylate deaminase zinc-binding region family protein [Candidatus Endolissoclinum faulkneri L2]|uniref:tRNA-specific adenosine deaminase n=1 Tax=Candidatus Endolissoclinum faulkneri L2 TaxID=1193729 RepID=K7Z2U4_9PROT|nr:cytidine and deoxycytidylate deaminase zinc-binding region family protein [Candidatus Endolissoclinum faulkneri L2]
MTIALNLAQIAAESGEVPVGAVIINKSGQLIARAHNQVESPPDPVGHAEILALRAAAKIIGSPRLMQCDLIVTLEPCAMCAQAIAHARIRRLIFGAYNQNNGGVEHGARIFNQLSCHHQPEVIGGVEETAASCLLKAFFITRRQNNN